MAQIIENTESNQFQQEILQELKQIRELLTILVGMGASDREDDGLEPLTYMDGTPRG